MTGDDRLRVLLIEPDRALGEPLAQALRRLGSEVVWFSGEAPAVPGVRHVPGRRHPEDLAAAGRGFDAAVDFAAHDLEAPAVVAAALRGRLGLLVQLGTWRIYEGAEDAPGCASPTPEASPGRPGMPVPCPEEASKRDGPCLDAEDGLWNRRAAGDYPATVLRLAELYGPGVALAREWHVVGRLRAGRHRMAVPDGGGQLLHRLYVDNAVHAVIAALDHPQEADGHAFNVGDARVPTLRELCAGCAAAAGRPLDLLSVPRRVLDTHSPWAVSHPAVLDLCRIRQTTGYAQPVPPEEGLARTVRWLMDLAADDVLGALEPYWRRFGCGHDHAGEEAALAAWGA